MSPAAPTDAAVSVVRFSRWARLQHALVMLLFVILLLTGLPQRWPYASVSMAVIDGLGGIYAVRWIHRVAAVGFTLLLLAHGTAVVAGLLLRRCGPSMLIGLQDFRDAADNLRYYAGRRRQPPRFDRYDYRQKFEYWGLLFGSTIMVLTGWILMYPVRVAAWLPAQLIPAAKVMHSNEALLALLIVLLWHLYGAHLNPEVFPADTSIFSGRISLARMRREHPLEYQRLVAARPVSPDPAAPVASGSRSGSVPPASADPASASRGPDGSSPSSG